MPIVSTDAPDPFALATGRLPNPAAAAAHDPDFLETAGAAFRQANVIGSAAERFHNFGGVTNDPEPNYSAWDDIKGTPYEDHWQIFAGSNNRRYTDALKRQVDTELQDRRTLAASGWTGTGLEVAAGIIDPTILIPVGGEIIKGRTAYTIGKSALSVGVAGGTAAAIQQTAISQSQELHTPEETGLAIGSSVVLGGLLGAGAAAVMRPAERAAASEALDKIITGEASVGAAQTPSASVADLTIAGTADKVAKATQFISPNLRLNQSPSAAAREVGQGLAEGTMYQAMNEEGRTLGPAVETLARMNYRARVADAVLAHGDIYKEMKQSGFNMPLGEFEEKIGQAMRAEDVGENDFISRAAKMWRETVVDPYFNEAKSAGLFEEGDDVKFAPSYFPRQYRTKVLTANEAQIKDEWTAYMEGRIQQDYATQAADLRDRATATDQELADLKLSPDERAATLAELEQRGTALDEANAEQVDRVTRINELRRAVAAARDEGNTVAESAAREQIAAVQREGGEGLSRYLSERRAIRSRHRRVDLNYAGLEDRQQQVLNGLSALEDANQRGLNRLVARGRVLQNAMQKLDPERIAGKVSTLKSSFAEVLRRSQKAQDRLARAAERLGDNAPAELADRLKREAAAEAGRHQRLTSLAERIDRLESLDPQARLDEVKATTDDLVSEVSDISLKRGEKAQRLRERLARLDPAKLDEQVKRLGTRKAEDMREFLNRFEIKRLGQGVDPMNAEAAPQFRDMAREIVDQVFDKLTGRDYGSGASVAPEYMTPVERGPVKERTLPIPDEVLQRQGVLNDNVVDVMHRYARVLGADTELTQRFGSPTLVDQITKIRDEYRTLRAGTEDPKELSRLTARERADIRDIQALRDLVRGTYKASENTSNFGRLVRALSHLNYIRSMGGAVIASLSDLYRPAMVHGLGTYMNEGIAPLLKNLEAVKLSVKEAQLAGQITERVLQHRMVSLGEIADPMARGSPVERMLENGSKIASRWNGIQHWTDGIKSLTSIMSQNRILNGEADARTLAFLGIDGDMASRINAQFAEHGEVMDGVHVAGTERWSDPEAVRAFRAAVSKDVDSIIVTPGVGDVPLFSHTPLGRMLLQFRSFMFAAHQRVLLRGMQEGKTRFVSGLVGMTSLGILAATLKAWRGGKERYERFERAAENPGYLIGEGLDNSGMFTLPFDVANTTEKLTNSLGFSFNPIKTPILSAGQLANPNSSNQAYSVRYASRGPLGTLLGPTAGMVEQGFTAGQSLTAMAQGDAPSTAAKNAATSFVPYNSYLGMREMLQAFEDDTPYSE